MAKYKQTLTYTLLLLFLTATNPLQAAQLDKAVAYKDEEERKIPETQQGLEVYDYTLHIRKQMDHELEDIEDLQDDLEEQAFGLAKKLENRKRELILVTVLQSKQNQRHYKYLFFQQRIVTRQQNR